MRTERDFGQQRQQLVATLKAEGLLKSKRVIDSIGKVPRELFIPDSLHHYAYDDAPLPIDYGQTISAPHGLASRGPGEIWSP